MSSSGRNTADMMMMMLNMLVECPLHQNFGKDARKFPNIALGLSFKKEKKKKKRRKKGKGKREGEREEIVYGMF